ncbi:MAG TPA: lysophospholipid acyltransferase family protein [Polyangium sp.]|nr:lysophospholipid acyltransferase family protein [Polyangium sp.]
MIRARRVNWFNAWFSGHARSRIRTTFGEVRVHGLERAQAHAREAPLIVVSNHTSWWDPLVALHVSTHLLEKAGHAMMDAKNLRRLPFFGLVGGFGVELGNAQDGAAVIEYAAKLLEVPNNLVWIFPQGAERPIHERPLGFRRGSGEIARLAPQARVLPLGLWYEFGGVEKPTLWLSFGDVVKTTDDAAENRAAQEEAVTAELVRIEGAMGRTNAGEFVANWKTPRNYVGVAMERMLAGMTKWWVGA